MFAELSKGFECRGFRIRRCSGRAVGHPPGPIKVTEHAQALVLLAEGVSTRAVAAQLGVSRASIMRWKRAERRISASGAGAGNAS